MKKIIITIIFLNFINTSFASTFGFGKKSWTSGDSQSVCNFIRSQKFMNETTRILNDSSVIIKQHTKINLINGYRNSLASAQLVEKTTLDKLHPAFFQNYENYKHGIQNRIFSLSESGSTSQAFKAHELIQGFSVWYNTNKNNVKIPKGVIANCRKNS